MTKGSDSLRLSKFIIPILAASLLCTGYILFRSYSVKAQMLSAGDASKGNSIASSLERQRGRQDEKSGEAAKTNNAVNQTGKGALPVPTKAAVPENGFSFAIQADSHLDQNTDTILYKQTLQNIAADKPLFLIDLGDTFVSEKFAKTQQEVEQRYTEAKSYFHLSVQYPCTW